MAANKEQKIYELMNEIRILTRSTLLHQNAIAQKIDLNVTDAECLDFLQQHGGCTAGELAKMTGLTTGAITNVIDRLENVGYVERLRDLHDRRKVKVVLKSNRSPAAPYYQKLASSVFKQLSSFTEKELKILHLYTRMLRKTYDEQFDLLQKK